MSRRHSYRQQSRRWSCPPENEEISPLFRSGQGESQPAAVPLIWQFLREHSFLSCSSLASLNRAEALDAPAEFITPNERLCGGPHSITPEPDDKLHRLPRLRDPEGCLINQRLCVAAASQRNKWPGQPRTHLPLPHIIICFPGISP